ncbi:DUF418 domain-containing protein [Pseudogracilibacillus sp. SO30301A]|uniref:DUF418 domain-containing protein n=1 Tax=Pseudogracilibacillus sp. SO30301A TaxID=3098291 RepID=UPI00300E374B
MNKKRIRLLDILRGFAIVGTLGTNIWIFAHLGDLSYITTYEYSSWWAFEDFLRMLILFLVNGKFLGLLTIMFGVGLELKYKQALRKSKPWPAMYIWTSVILITEGFIHFLLVMEYDILMSYGVTAIIVSFIIKGGDAIISKSMKIIGSIHAVFILFLLVVAILGANMSLGSFYEVTLLYQNGTWIEQIQYRLANFLILRSEAILVIPMNIFLFLLGVRLMRLGVFAPDENGKQKRKKLFHIGIYVGLPLNLLIFIPGGAFDLPVRYLFAPLLSLGYLALIARMVEKNEAFWLWKQLEHMGKMSLSCYVMQNILASCIFYGWGLGLGGNVNSIMIILIWMLISGFLMIFSSCWIQHFKQGPMESIRKYTASIIQR